MKTFEIALKNEKEKSYRLIIFFIALLHVIFFTWLLFDKELWKKGAVGLVCILLYVIYRLIISKGSDTKFYFGEGFFFVFGVVGIIDFEWLGWGDMILFILSTIALQPILFIFSSSFIALKGFPFKKYKWDDFSNIILKDNILTLDFKSNKIIQGEIVTTNINEEAFNNFVNGQLVKKN